MPMTRKVLLANYAASCLSLVRGLFRADRERIATCANADIEHSARYERALGKWLDDLIALAHDVHLFRFVRPESPGPCGACRTPPAGSCGAGPCCFLSGGR